MTNRPGIRLLAGIILISSLLSLFSCIRKGKDDPFISVHTRKARLAGSWQLRSGNWIQADTNSKFDNGNLIVDLADSLTDTLSFSLEYTFDREGTFTSTMEVGYPTNYHGSTSPANRVTTSTSGIWSFLSASPGHKKDSELTLRTSEVKTSSTVTGSNVDILSISGQSEGKIYGMIKLSSSELVLESDMVETSNASVAEYFEHLQFVKE